MLSARNILDVKICQINIDGLMAEVVGELANGEQLRSVITVQSARSLGLEVGKNALFICKASAVMLSSASCAVRTSCANALKAKITGVQPGAVNATILLQAQGCELCASITEESRKRMEIAPGGEVVALIKATNFMVGIKQ